MASLTSAPQNRVVVPNGGPTDQPEALGDKVQKAKRLQARVRELEADLRKAELSAVGKNAGIGFGMFLGAAVFGLFAFALLTVALAEGLHAAGLWRWLAYIAAAVIYLVLSGLLALFGKNRIGKVEAPKRTIAALKADIATLRHPTQVPPGA